MSQPFQRRFADFGEMDVAPGSVFGFRWWLMSPALEVRGAANGVWQVGEENIAQCRDMGISTGIATVGGVFWFPDPAVYAPPPPPHRAPNELCACGFYAFWDTASPIQVYPSLADVVVAGVIEGYGKTLIGDLGFKSEKARIRGVVTSRAGMHWSVTPDASAWDGMPRVREQQAQTAAAAAGVFERAGVPVYPDPEALLAAHPLTTEYRRQAPATPDPPVPVNEEGP